MTFVPTSSVMTFCGSFQVPMQLWSCMNRAVNVSCMIHDKTLSMFDTIIRNPEYRIQYMYYLSIIL